MALQTSTKNGFSVKAYQGDAKTLLAFNLPNRQSAKDLAGFTIQCQPDGQDPYFLFNTLRFQTPGQHTQVATEPPASSVNSPFHKFRWLHIPGSNHQGTKPFMGRYTYTVTPRFFDDKQSLQPIDPARSVSVKIDVVPFQKNGLALAFTRGFVQSQAFVHHFGLNALIRPKNKDLIFDTSEKSGVNALGEAYTFLDQYEWMGYTARQTIFAVLQEVVDDKSLHMDVFAYDLNEPDVVQVLLKLAGQGRLRMILDNASLHHNAKTPAPEDKFEQLFRKATGKKDSLKRGKFGRFAHDKVFIVYDKNGPVKVLTGSTNFSVTGLYVNNNHVLVFEDAKVAGKYAEVFDEAWQDGVSKSFNKSELAGETFTVSSRAIPQTEITFSPHQSDFASKILQGMAARIGAEARQDGGSVLFAVMQLTSATGPVLPALQKLHASQKIFSFGISDSPGGIALYKPGRKTGVLVTGKPTKSKLPPPFDQVPGVGAGHQVHHKFVVCGFNGPRAVVYCGSSNLALGGEQANGDNLIAIHDTDVATVFAVEALALVDHFNFLDSAGVGPTKKQSRPKFASQLQEAVSAGWFLSTTDTWVDPYFDPRDLHCVDRKLFG
jgi:phosphatidylserine/phosphatidylglycerophosphate/cardiolipin synthase-like enzyme